MNIKSFKKFIENKINEFINVTDNLSNTIYFNKEGNLNSIEENIREILETVNELNKDFKKDVYKLTKELENLKNIIWDKINIVLFGETNAGKSTLLEALICGDGRSIGDGRKDFTKNCIKYKFDDFYNIVDTPGIEGNETLVKKNIEKAINKSHIVFYIFSSNKEPEEGTLEKIKHILNENSFVYGIINMRGFFKNSYELQKAYEDINIVVQRSSEKLFKIFGNRFKGIFIIHALYAFYSRAKSFNPSNNTSIIISKKKANNIINEFGGEDQLEQASNITVLIEELNKIKQYYLYIILWSNSRRILYRQEKIIDRIISVKKRFDQYLMNLNNSLNQFEKKYNQEVTNTKVNIQKIVDNSIKTLKNELIEKLYTLIDKGVKEKKEYYKETEAIINKHKKIIQKEIETELRMLEKKIREEAENLEKNVEEVTKFFQKYKKIDFTNIVDNLRMKFNDFITETIDVVSKVIDTIIAWAIHPVLGIIVLAISAIKKIFDWFRGIKDQKRKDAKNEIYKKITEETNKIKEDLKNKVDNKILKEIDKLFQQSKKRILKKKRDLIVVSYSLNNIITDLKIIHHDISFNFFKNLCGNIQFVYLQTSLEDSICLVSDNEFDSETLKEILNFCGFKNIHIYCEKEKLFSDISGKEDEFLKRLKSFLKNDYPKIEIKSLNQ